MAKKGQKVKRSEAHVYLLLSAALEGICFFSTQETENSIQDQRGRIWRRIPGHLGMPMTKRLEEKS
jgi:hypothetical protein